MSILTLETSSSHPPTQESFDHALSLFKETIDREDIGFFGLPDRTDLLEESRAAFNKFQSKKTLVHIGIGGSALGPQMLIQALKRNKEKQITFFNNIDPDDIHEKLTRIKDIEETLFFVVTKSGGTAETLACFSLVANFLEQKGISKNHFKNYFLFATDKENGDLRSLANKLEIESLTIPSNVGGRFGALTPSGLFPMLFVGAKSEEILQGAKTLAPLLLTKNQNENLLIGPSLSLVNLYRDLGIDETVIMPYSSKLRLFSNWFIQLWAESLGKEFNDDKKIVNEGLTPIASYGATDQHSQMQLFMEGPYNKLILFLEVEKFQQDFELKNEFEEASLKRLSPHSLASLMKAELEGTKRALKENQRPWINIKVEQVDERSVGALILYFECLTVIVGRLLKIDPFNQPGVEKGKIYSYEWLEK